MEPCEERVFKFSGTLWLSSLCGIASGIKVQSGIDGLLSHTHRLSASDHRPLLGFIQAGPSYLNVCTLSFQENTSGWL